MSKLQELIGKLCPTGVDFKKLGEVAPFVTTRVNTSDVNLEAYVGVDGLLQDKLGRAKDTDVVPEGRHIQFLPGDTLLGNIRPYLRKIWFADCMGGTNGDVLVFRASSSIDSRYLFHILSSEDFFLYDIVKSKGSKMPRGDKDAIQQYRLPVPPIEVQREIVRILDSMQELDDALSAEIEAREKQLETTRHHLLDKNAFDSSELKSLEATAKRICTGATPNKKRPEFYEGGNVPWLRTQEVVFRDIYEVSGRITEIAIQNTAAKWIPENCVIIAISGASAGRCGINKMPVATNQHCFNIEIDSNTALYRFVFHCVWNQYDELLGMRDGPRGDLNGTKIKSLVVPVPSLDVQAELLDILDSQLSLINELIAERDARRKQFEYYRDRLLSIPEKVA